MGPDHRLQRAVLAEMRLRERRELRRRDRDRPEALAERLHHGDDDLIAHLRRVARRVPDQFRSVAWLHHASDALRTADARCHAGLTSWELKAIELLAGLDPPDPASRDLARYGALARVPGEVGQIVRVVGAAALTDRR
jgi:hypothetical protein